MAYLLAKDTQNGAEGKIIVTLDGQNREVAFMRNIRATANVNTEDMRVIGTRKVQKKMNGVALEGTGNAYYGPDQGLWRDMVLQYINTGVMPEFSIQITNQDPATSLGTEVTAYYGCYLTGEIPLSILDSEEAMLNYDLNFTYTNVQRLQDFNQPERLGS